MIYVIHGQDVSASHVHLNSLLTSYIDYQKINLDKEKTYEDLQNALTSQDFFTTKEIIVCTNFITDKKITAEKLKDLKSLKDLIFWEKDKVSLAGAKPLTKITIAEFKLPPTLFHFLDSIAPNSKTYFTHINKLGENPALIWCLLERLLLLILSKQNLTAQQAQNIIKKPIADWQWQKIAAQARKFRAHTLYAMFDSVLKVDLMKKQGKTDASDISLINLLLIKHLKPPGVLQ